MSAAPQTRAADTPVDWYTPPELFTALGLEFDLDPCAPPLPRADWIPARHRLSLPDDGLAASWHQPPYYKEPADCDPPCRYCDKLLHDRPRIWLNPPYGEQTGRWVGKLADHGRGIALVFARTDTAWWQAAAARATAVTMLAGRVEFVPGHRSGRDTFKSPAPSCLLAYGGHEAQACADSGLGLTFDAREILSKPQLQGAFC